MSFSSDPEASASRSFLTDFFAFIMAGLPFMKRNMQELFPQYKFLMEKGLAFLGLTICDLSEHPFCPLFELEPRAAESAGSPAPRRIPPRNPGEDRAAAPVRAGKVTRARQEFAHALAAGKYERPSE